MEDHNKFISSFGFILPIKNRKQTASILDFISEIVRIKDDYIAFVVYHLWFVIIIKFIDDSKGIRVVDDGQYIAKTVRQKHPDFSCRGIALYLHEDDLFKGYLTRKSIGRIIRQMANLDQDTPVFLKFLPSKYFRNNKNKLNIYINKEYLNIAP